MIYDCFTFFNEVDVAEIRVRELASIPDLVHIAVIAYADHRGRPTAEPRSNIDILMSRVADVCGVTRLKFWSEEIHLGGLYPRERESLQRNGISRAVARAGATDDDVVIISDADEVPRAEAVLRYASGMSGVHALMMSQHCHWLDAVVAGEAWPHAKIMRRRDMEWGACPDHIRLSAPARVVDHGGWHFSWMGGLDAVRKKLSTFSHREFDTPEYHDEDRILRAMEGDRQFWTRKRLEVRPIDSHFPSCLRDEPGRWAHLIRGAKT